MIDPSIAAAPHAQRCSFCRAPREEVRSLVLGPSISICDACVRVGMQILLGGTAEPVPLDTACSFCTKARREVHVLIPGPAVNICDECMQLCGDILAEDGRPEVAPELPIARIRKPQWWKRWSRRA